MTARPDDPDFLELCPCCGGDGIYVDSCSDCAAQWSVGCTTCWLHNNAHTRADALAAWNRRAALEPQDAPAVAGVEIPTGFTPGPWRVGPVDDTRVEDAQGLEVAQIDGDYNEPDLWPIMEANARLIALAPAMAEELLALRAEVARLREDRLAAFDTCIKEAADLRNTQDPGQLSWWACNELLGRFHAARGKIARAALTPSAKEGRSDG